MMFESFPSSQKNEPLPTLKATIRLLRCIFTGASEVPEFQRQVSTPNVPKFSQALVSLGEKTDNEELKVISLYLYRLIIKTRRTGSMPGHPIPTRSSLPRTSPSTAQYTFNTYPQVPQRFRTKTHVA